MTLEQQLHVHRWGIAVLALVSITLLWGVLDLGRRLAHQRDQTVTATDNLDAALKQRN